MDFTDNPRARPTGIKLDTVTDLTFMTFPTDSGAKEVQVHVRSVDPTVILIPILITVVTSTFVGSLRLKRVEVSITGKKVGVVTVSSLGPVSTSDTDVGCETGVKVMTSEGDEVPVRLIFPKPAHAVTTVITVNRRTIQVTSTGPVRDIGTMTRDSVSTSVSVTDIM